MPTEEIAEVYEDHNKILWVLTNDNKVGIFNTTTFKYKEVPLQSWNNGNIYAKKTFLETHDGKLLLYINYSNNLFEFNAASSTFVRSNYIKLPDNWRINNLLQDKATHKFYITTDSVYVIYNPKTRNISYANHNAANEHLITHTDSDTFFIY